uniref:Uncharacterized protein n=1 Tax=Xenopus tropicalis TaxID=8364 RepID=A0A1B8Y1J4_XENTR
MAPLSIILFSFIQEGAGDALPQDYQEPEKSLDDENRRDMPPFEPYFDSGESEESSDSDEQQSEEGAPSELIWMSSLDSLFFVTRPRE